MFLEYILNLIKIFILDFFYKLSNLNINIFYDFILLNKIILLFIFFTYIGICFDSRFKLNRKILIFFFISLFLLLFIVYEYKDLNLFFKELYWYTLVINSCFVVHVLYLYWIYLYFWKRRYEKICWILSTIAFIFSMSFIVFLLLYIYIEVKILFKIHKKDNILSDIVKNLIKNLILVIAIVLRFFIFIFANYTSIVVGTYKITNLSIKYILLMIFYFWITIIISYWVLGIARIVFIWICIFIAYSYQHFYNYYKNEGRNKSFRVIFWYFFFRDFEWVIRNQIDKPSLKCLFLEDRLSIANYKELYFDDYLLYIYIQTLEIKKNNLFNYNKINWYGRAFLVLIKVNYLNDNTIKNRIADLKEKFNLSDHEIMKLKSDYREYFLKRSIIIKK